MNKIVSVAAFLGLLALATFVTVHKNAEPSLRAGNELADLYN